MPLLNTSKTVLNRVKCLLEASIKYANNDLENDEDLIDKVVVRWKEAESRSPQLIVQATLPDLGKLISLTGAKKLSNQNIREALQTLEKFLEICEDNRVKTQGSENWNFTLKLWGKSVARNLEAVERLWNDRKLGRAQTFSFDICHNLPARSHSSFIGKQSELTHLSRLISPKNSDTSLVWIQGTGGVGKTTLALEVAYRCLKASEGRGEFLNYPKFTSIIFISAQSQRFLGSEFIERLNPDRTLRDIFRAILKTLNSERTLPSQLNEQLRLVQDILRKHKTLLILDNLETIEEGVQQILAFLGDLPASVKTIVTSRRKFALGYLLCLEGLSRVDGLNFIRHIGREKAISLTNDEAEQIYRATGGLPLAIACSIGYIAVYGLSPLSAIQRLLQPKGSLLDYCYTYAIEQLKGKPAFWLLIAFSFFPQSVSKEALVATALECQENGEVENSLALLNELSLLPKSSTANSSLTKADKERLSIHPLTREFISGEIKQHSDFEFVARKRWIKWYLNYCQPYGEFHWLKWLDYSLLEQEWINLRQVMDWCQYSDEYEVFCQLWQSLKGYTLLMGYWQERLIWLDWLEQQAKQKNDHATLADVIFHQSLTLAYQDQSDAEGRVITLGEKAWKLGQEREADFQIEIAIYLAQIHSYKKEFKTALDWIDKARQLVIDTKGEDKGRKSLQWLLLLYVWAGIYFESEDWELAEARYLEAQKLAQIIKEDRIFNYVQGRLAATYVQRDELDKAEILLKKALSAAEENHDKRSLAFCYFYLALIEKKKKNFSEMKYFAKMAYDCFVKLGMNNEALQIKKMIE